MVRLACFVAFMACIAVWGRPTQPTRQPVCRWARRVALLGVVMGVAFGLEVRFIAERGRQW
jgi:hypothetical protein